MDTITPFGGKGGTVASLPVFRIRTVGTNEPEDHATERVWSVENDMVDRMTGDAGFVGPWEMDSGRLVLATTRLAIKHQRSLVALKRKHALGFHITNEELLTLSRMERLLGVSHPGAQDELLRLNALPCRPFIDEIVFGLLLVVNLMHAKAHCFDLCDGEAA